MSINRHKQMEQMWCLYAMEYYSVVKKKRVKSCHLQQYGGIQVKDKYDKYDFTYMHNLKSRTN